MRVLSITRGQGHKKTKSLLFYGMVSQLTWDPGRFRWKDLEQTPLLAYSTKLGRQVLATKLPPPNVVIRKWQGVLPASYKLQWSKIWTSARTRKEAGLLWLISHRDVAVNEWRRSCNNAMLASCVMCDGGHTESILHRFWDCEVAALAWKWGCYIIGRLVPDNQTRREGLNFNWKQGLFNDKLPRRFRSVYKIWDLLRGVIVWTLWIARNDMVFNGNKWNQQKILHTIWLGLVDYSRLAWNSLKVQPIEVFCESWGRSNVLATVVNGRPKWILTGPVATFLLSV